MVKELVGLRKQRSLLGISTETTADDLLKAIHHQDDIVYQMEDAEILTTPVVRAQIFSIAIQPMPNSIAGKLA